MLKHRANPLGSYHLKDAETVVVEPETQAGKTIVPAGTWSADPDHSSVEFKVKHPAMFAAVMGRFAKFEASVEAASEEAESARAVALIEAASIDTSQSARDDDLRSPRFFDAATYPQISLLSGPVVDTSRSPRDFILSLTPESPAPPDTVRASCALCDWTTSGSPRRVCAEQARHRREAHGFVTEQELRKQARVKQLEPLLRELPGTSGEVAARLGTKPQTVGQRLMGARKIGLVARDAEGVWSQI